MRKDDDHDLVCASKAKHLVVVAPPGTGKTFVSVRLAGVIARTLAPSERVLLITFSNQARARLEEEASRQLDPLTRQAIEVANYHGFFWRGVRAYRRYLGLPPNVQLCSRSQRLAALRQVDASAVRLLGKQEGLLESAAEWAFPQFRDNRTPTTPETLDRLLQAVRCEQTAGRLLFDDLAALFWQLLDSSPSIETAYKSRYPVVIADEHQDSSEIQDAFVRRLGERRIILLADPMQLIYGFRGSDPKRLARHEQECTERLELNTPHRWAKQPVLGQWLQAVRARLQGHERSAETPSCVRIVKTDAMRGVSGMKPALKYAVSKALREAESVAVLSAWNNDMIEARSYLSREGFFPQQLGGAGDFEEARAEIEELPSLVDKLDIAKRALQRIGILVPSLESDVVRQVERRLTASGINTKGKCNDVAAGLLRALAPILDKGAVAYFKSVAAGLDFCNATGHHLPRREPVRALRRAAELPEVSLEHILDGYSNSIVAASHAATRAYRGLIVMTVHQAKGKEFDAIILLNATQRHFPDTEEGRRLFYVAITRASKSWTIITPAQNETPLLAHL